MTRVEVFEQIRKDYYLSNCSIRAIAKRYKIHRRTVRQAIANPIPPSRIISASSTNKVLTDEIKQAIDEWLLADKKAPKKQKHTSQRIFTRLIELYNFTGKLPTIKRHVGQRRRELGLKQQGFIPLAYEPGQEAEVDWYEAYVDFPWVEKKKIYIFQMRSCFSGKEFHMAFPRCTQQAFLEAHVKAFIYFGGVFHKIRYDNLSSAVSKVFRGRKRQETEKFTLLKSHYLFETIFCKPGKSGAHEKGGVECGVGRFRRQHLVPVPIFESFNQLNKYIVECCNQDDTRQIIGKQTIIKDDWNKEHTKLLPLPKQPFDFCKVSTIKVNSRSLITIGTQRYSVPVKHIGLNITVKMSSLSLACYYQGKCIAKHIISTKPYEITTVLDHYLELLWTKPSALPNALPLAQAKNCGQWNDSLEVFWQQLIDRYGQYEGTRQFIDVLMLHRKFSAVDIKQAIQSASHSGWYSFDAIVQLLSPNTTEPQELLKSLKHLTGFEREPSQIQQYDNLLNKGAA